MIASVSGAVDGRVVGGAHVTNVCITAFVGRLLAPPLIIVATDFLGGLAVRHCLCVPIGRVGNHPKTGLLGLRGQTESVWSSCRQNVHRGIALALPVKASLYKREFSADQLRSLRARASLRY